MRIAFGGGGTGGHVVPALAIALQLRAMGHDAFFIGNSASIEERLSKAEGFAFFTIKVKKLYRAGILQNILFPYYLFNSIITSIRILKKQRPDAVFCTGGFVSGPVAIASLLLHIPLFGHESNSYPGLVTRALARFFTCIFISFDASRKYLSHAKISNHGIPILPKKSGSFNLDTVGLDAGKSIILVSGGSQGSLAINKAVDMALEQIIGLGYQVIWQTGKHSFNQFSHKYDTLNGLYMFDFSPMLPVMLDHVRIAITRAGALTIAELEEKHIPAILIPLPTAAENHQFHNAVAQKEKGVAYLLEQNKLDSNALVNAIQHIDTNYELYQSAFKLLPPNNAASDIASDIIKTLQTRTR